MALIVEDGTGKSDAESYASVAEATTYFGKRGKADAWDAVDDKEAALRLATDYMLQVYRPLWAGVRRHDDQALDWPRINVPKVDSAGGYRYYPAYYEDDEIPSEVKRACFELALRSLGTTDLLIDREERKIRREKVGPLETEYFEGGSEQTAYPMVDAMLQLLFSDEGNGLSVSVARA